MEMVARLNVAELAGSLGWSLNRPGPVEGHNSQEDDDQPQLPRAQNEHDSRHKGKCPPGARWCI
jgi:hypothetical protein